VKATILAYGATSSGKTFTMSGLEEVTSVVAMLAFSALVSVPALTWF
jgi:ribosome-interacting GTPase 1